MYIWTCMYLHACTHQTLDVIIQCEKRKNVHVFSSIYVCTHQYHTPQFFEKIYKLYTCMYISTRIITDANVKIGHIHVCMYVHV